MAFRFKRICSPIKGLKVNVNKGSISSSVGLPGLGATMGSRGVSANLGMPGTGLSYRSDVNWNNKQKSNDSIPKDFDNDLDFDDSLTQLEPLSQFTLENHKEKHKEPSLQFISKQLNNKKLNNHEEIKHKLSKYPLLIRVVPLLISSLILILLKLKVVPVILFGFAIYKLLQNITTMDKRTLL